MQPNDFGPIYAETDMTRFPVEPWNTMTNLVFLFIIVYFSRKTRLNWKIHPFLIVCLPILTIGFTGGTIYHASRSDRIWLYLDFMPIMILALLASVYFLSEATKKKGAAILAVITAFFGMGFLRSYLELPKFLSIAVGYGSLAILIVGSSLLLARKDSWRNVSLIIASLVIFSFGLTFRTIDLTLGKELLPMGTHFLWHLCGGTAVFCLFEFVFRRDLYLNKLQVTPEPEDKLSGQI